MVLIPVVADDPAHRPGLLPGPPVDPAGVDLGEAVGEDVVVAVPPGLLDEQDRQAQQDQSWAHLRRAVIVTGLRSRLSKLDLTIGDGRRTGRDGSNPPGSGKGRSALTLLHEVKIGRLGG